MKHLIVCAALFGLAFSSSAQAKGCAAGGNASRLNKETAAG